MKRSNVTQMELELKVITSKEVDGIEMGVLDDGTPFLTERGLAKVCGVSNSTLVKYADNTLEGDALRATKISELLAAQGFEGDSLFVRTEYKGTSVKAYPDSVCMALLEYYAFEAGRYCNETAKNNYRILARKSLRDFIYRMTGYDPVKQILQSWQHFHDRLLLNPIPVGYFSVFRETADLVLESIRNGLEIDSHTVPDISVGKLWSERWFSSDLEKKYGERAKYPHLYPDYFPQAVANGSIDVYIYPVSVLGEFKHWIQTEYLPQKYPSYLNRKAKQGVISASKVPKILKALEPIRLNPAG
ncbi:hypothetical protein H6F43_04040 [Leptolyngbya sp. FACHB-36]|uniref:hypothetical protein n=1 Tax=Leptolyngbya sp. FACHB-36 TaxID=2692808 RepID=UPI001680E72E|nr:hypothetical protein [Leptolyngbya sp. FACHB-36]MBD2019353.1 hypothetical protein [Leptolyngbya sp. FACHB-36]